MYSLCSKYTMMLQPTSFPTYTGPLVWNRTQAEHTLRNQLEDPSRRSILGTKHSDPTKRYRKKASGMSFLTLIVRLHRPFLTFIAHLLGSLVLTARHLFGPVTVNPLDAQTNASVFTLLADQDDAPTPDFSESCNSVNRRHPAWMHHGFQSTGSPTTTSFPPLHPFPLFPHASQEDAMHLAHTYAGMNPPYAHEYSFSPSLIPISMPRALALSREVDHADPIAMHADEARDAFTTALASVTAVPQARWELTHAAFTPPGCGPSALYDTPLVAVVTQFITDTMERAPDAIRVASPAQMRRELDVLLMLALPEYMLSPPFCNADGSTQMCPAVAERLRHGANGGLSATCEVVDRCTKWYVDAGGEVLADIWEAWGAVLDAWIAAMMDVDDERLFY